MVPPRRPAGSTPPQWQGTETSDTGRRRLRCSPPTQAGSASWKSASEWKIGRLAELPDQLPQRRCRQLGGPPSVSGFRIRTCDARLRNLAGGVSSRSSGAKRLVRALRSRRESRPAYPTSMPRRAIDGPLLGPDMQLHAPVRRPRLARGRAGQRLAPWGTRAIATESVGPETVRHAPSRFLPIRPAHATSVTCTVAAQGCPSTLVT